MICVSLNLLVGKESRKGKIKFIYCISIWLNILVTVKHNPPLQMCLYKSIFTNRMLFLPRKKPIIPVTTFPIITFHVLVYYIWHKRNPNLKLGFLTDSKGWFSMVDVCHSQLMDTKDLLKAWILNLRVFVLLIESNYSTKINISITQNPAGR